MKQFVQSFLLFLFACLPTFFFRPFRRKRFFWCFILCALSGAFLFQPFPRFALFFYALLLGLCLLLVVYMPLEHGKLSGFLLCWSCGLAVLSIGRPPHTAALSGRTEWLVLSLSLFAALVFAFFSRWLSRWEIEDTVWLSEERKVSPLPLLITISFLLLLLTFGETGFSIDRIVIAGVLQILLLMILSLWSNMALSVLHSKESSENSRKSVHLIDSASRSSEATLQRQLTESNNKLQQVSLAYQNGDEAALSVLLDLPEDTGSSYCSLPLLDAILRHSARKSEAADLLPNFQLQLGSMRNFFLPDVGVLVDLMLELMTERHPGKPDTLRLRMQEWGDALVVVVGRRDPLHTVPENTMNTLLQLTEEYHGWLEFAEKGHGIRLSAVLFRPAAKK